MLFTFQKYTDFWFLAGEFTVHLSDLRLDVKLAEKNPKKMFKSSNNSVSLDR